MTAEGTACMHWHVERFGTAHEPARAAECVECGKGFVSEDYIGIKLDEMAAPIVALPDGRVGRRDRPIGQSVDDSFDLGYMKAIRDLRNWLIS